MTEQPELLKTCRDYFNQAQLSWDKYFTKWEAMAQEEDIDDCDKDYLSFTETKPKILKKKGKSFKCKRHIKSVVRGRKENNKGKEKLAKKRKKVHRETSNHERGNEIIHKTENQTNLECEVVNNKHFEADLKAIFIEILSENTNKVGMFSVLCRMFPGKGNTISNISLSSVLMERNEFSINPVNNIILHSSSRNEFCRGISPCRPDHIGFHSSIQISNDSQVHICSKGDLPFLNDSYAKHPSKLIYMESWVGKTNHDGKDPEQVSYAVQTLENETLQHLERKSTFSSTSCNWDSIFAQLSKTAGECMNQSTDNELRSLTSPEATLRKILSPKQIQLEPPRSLNLTRKRKKFNPIQYDSSDDSGDEKNNYNDDGSQGRFLKIFCTPKRPRQCTTSKKNNSSAIIEDSSDEDCFHIVDRVKTTRT